MLILHGDGYSYDVLFMTEPLDELTVQAIGEFGGKPLTDLGKENVDFAGDEEEKAKKEEQSTDTQGACTGFCRKGLDGSYFAKGRHHGSGAGWRRWQVS